MSLGSKISKEYTASMGMRSSKAQEVHLNKRCMLLCSGKIVQPFEIGVFPPIIYSEVIFYFSRVAKEFNKFKGCAAVNTFQGVVTEVE